MHIPFVETLLVLAEGIARYGVCISLCAAKANDRLGQVAKACLTQANGATIAQKLEPFAYYYGRQHTMPVGHPLRALHHDPVRDVILEPSQIDRTTSVTKR